jgi:uncharacterized protein involved in exopolysaccharide biosynthesis
MANVARDKVNYVAQRLNKESQVKLLAAFEDNMTRKSAELDMLADSIRLIQATSNVFDPGAVSGALSNQLATAESEITRTKARLDVLSVDPLIPPDTISYIRANLKAYEELKRVIKTDDPKSDRISLRRVNEMIPTMAVLQDMHYQARKQLTFDLERYNQIRSAYNTDIPALLVVEHAEVPMFKSRPKRSIIIIASLVGAFLFALLGALLAESVRTLDWKTITTD